MRVLADILASKRREVEALKARASGHRAPHEPSVAREAPRPRDPLDVVGALRRPAGAPLRLVTEVKLRSPSAGPLSRAMPPEERAAVYAAGGAAMVSILCDGPFFDGSWEHLASARARIAKTPLLAKEFVLDPVQVVEARDRGGDAVLLIARIVDRATLASLARTAREAGLEPLVEVVDEGELEAALAADARVIGVNARDLDTLAMDAARTARVLEAIPAGVVAVHLSGIRDADDVRRVAASRADAALVGEALMREDDPRARLASFLDAAGGR
ncbi:MAG TPA: indole-3-glycerol phosphate synthase TrpC [Polyangiaceae bacterium]